MIPLRITSSTSVAFDSLKARMARLSTALASGSTTTEALNKADAELAQIATEARALRIAVRQEIAGAKARQREDLPARKAAS